MYCTCTCACATVPTRHGCMVDYPSDQPTPYNRPILSTVYDIEMEAVKHYLTCTVSTEKSSLIRSSETIKTSGRSACAAIDWSAVLEVDRGWCWPEEEVEVITNALDSSTHSATPAVRGCGDSHDRLCSKHNMAPFVWHC